jgi:hypothetical protein
MSEMREPSYKNINYALRPRKQIERKIMIETLLNMKPSIDIEKYKYIGMGSIYYYDFILFHKYLNIGDLQSFDDKSTEKRFNYNRPYEFVKFKNCKSTEFLNEYDWNDQKNLLIWLDYDGFFKKDILEDLEIIATRCKKNDIFIFTINVTCPINVKNKKLFFNKFKNFMCDELQDKKFISEKYFTRVIQDICLNHIKQVEVHRDAKFHQIFSFEYQDGAKMYTLGGIFNDSNEIIKKIEKLKYVKTGNESIKINVPLLTYCEKYYLDVNIEKVRTWINDIETETPADEICRKDKMTKEIDERLPFEIARFDEVKSYVNDFYKYYPQYFEGII